METQETFADAHESLSTSFLSTAVALVRDDGIDLAAEDLVNLLRRESREQPTSSESCSSSYQVGTSCTEFNEDNVQNQFAAAFVEGDVHEVHSYCNNIQEANSGSTQEQCLMNQFVGGPRLPNCLNFANYKDLDACSCSASEETKFLDHLTVSSPLNIICRASISFKNPVKFKTKMEFLFGSSNLQKETTANELNKLILENMRVADAGNSYNHPKSITISPIGQWVINAINGNRKISNILRGPLCIQLADQVRRFDQDKLTSTESRKTSCADFDSFPVELCGTSSHTQEAESVRDRYDSDLTGQEFSDDLSFSCSSSKMADSYQTSLTSSLSISRGVLQCSWEGGIPHFMFFSDDKGKFYGAKPWRIESSEDKFLDWMYVFYTKASGQEKQINGIGRFSDIVGKMKVSSSLALDCENANQLEFIETQYVLFGVNERHDEELKQGMSPLNMVVKKTKGMQKIVGDIFKASQPSKPRTVIKSAPSNSNSNDLCRRGYHHKGTNFNNTLSAESLLMDQLIPNLELAAMVVKGCLDQKNAQESDIGGWGLKFLKKKREDTDSKLSSDGNEPIQRSKDKSILNMTVLMPENFHGGPLTRNGGPSSLIERWKSGGLCDCGGWDMGCPLKVLDHRSCDGTNVGQGDSQEECTPFNLFIKGNKQDSPVLKMVNVCEGLYFIHFQSTLSALRCFSIGVAIIHSQSPSLFSKLYD